jgi:cyanate lyase
MASFIVFNVQLLPVDTSKTPEVGVTGYKNLLDGLHSSTTDAFKEQQIDQISFPLLNEAFMAPRSTITTDDYAYGQWLKYNLSDDIEDLYSNAKLFTATKGTFPIANRHSFDYIFDYQTHRLAIQEVSGKLPSPEVCIKIFNSIFGKIADRLFPYHILKINLISDPTKLEQIFNTAAGYKSVKTTLTFPNGHMLGSQLKELKDNNVHHLRVEASTESKDTAMPTLPGFLKQLVEASVEYGQTSLAYITEAGGKLMRYASASYPLKIKLRQKKDEQPAEMRRRVLVEIRRIGGVDTEDNTNV